MTPTLHALFAAALVLSSSRLPSAPSRIDGRLDDPIWARRSGWPILHR